LNKIFGSFRNVGKNYQILLYEYKLLLVPQRKAYDKIRLYIYETARFARYTQINADYREYLIINIIICVHLRLSAVKKIM